jgi:hypothetical protein
MIQPQKSQPQKIQPKLSALELRIMNELWSRG